MRNGLKAKFEQNSHLKDFLMATGDRTIVEGSPGDTFWGAGLSIFDPRIWKTNTWMGTSENHMGKLLQETRLNFKREGY